MQTDQLDQGSDLHLRSSQAQRSASVAQPPRQHGQVQHQGRVRERQVREIDDHIALGFDRSGQGPPAEGLSGPVFLTLAAEDGGGVIKLDDPGTLSESGAFAKWFRPNFLHLTDAYR